MRLRRTPSSRAVRVSALLCCLVGLAATVGTEARSDAPASHRLRGMDNRPLDNWEQTTARLEEPKGATGGLSDGDDWLG
jgi:hypothetical protein